METRTLNLDEMAKIEGGNLELSCGLGHIALIAGMGTASTGIGLLVGAGIAAISVAGMWAGGCYRRGY